MAADGSLIGEPNEDHADIARRVLPTHGVEAQDYGDLYVQMFRLGYARVVVDAQEFKIERKAGLSSMQQHAVNEALRGGNRVLVNHQRFVESQVTTGKATNDTDIVEKPLDDDSWI
jgi:hypothetical protein